MAPPPPRLFACFGRGGGASSSSASPEANATADLTAEEQRRMGPVLVELFSSQGCATSTQAEDLVSLLGRGELLPAGGEEGDHQAAETPPVAVLAFHVEYWDYKGWKDPFGSSMWTVRQKAYVESLKLDTLYTPQVVVHGRTQCVGTDQAAILAAVRAAPRYPSPTMQASFEKPSDHTLQVRFKGELRVDINGDADVMVALYESSLVTEVNKGENKGRILNDDYVVRRMEKLIAVKGAKGKKKKIAGAVNFSALWDGFERSKCGVILFVQSNSLQIFGVQQFQIPPSI